MTTPLKLHMHPLASYCWKVLIALHENGTAFDPVVPPGPSRTDPTLTARWPFGRIPVLEDTARGEVVAETSIAIDYLQQFYPGPERLIPQDPAAGREVRLWDRVADLYLSTYMQKIVGDRLRPEGRNDPYGVDEARGQLHIAYGLLDQRLAGRTWLGGEAFSMADCAAIPPLFFLRAIEPYTAWPALSAYFERGVERPSVRRVIEAAKPFFQYFPFAEGLERRFLPA